MTAKAIVAPGGCRIESGAIALIVGPSGAGKDTLIAAARAGLEGDARFVFVRRIVTRAAHADSEAHDSMSLDELARAEAEGRFLLSWRAHGLGYAIPGSASEALQASKVVVANVSRGVIGAAEARIARVLVVNVTAPADVLARRIAARGREPLDAITARIARDAPVRVERAQLVEIVNDGPIAAGATRLAGLLRQLATASAESARSL